MENRPLIDAFRDWTGNDPSFLVHAPGRVNLIGEHTDYNGYPVLPIAIPHSIRAAVSARNDRIVSLRNIHPEFSHREFALETNIPHAAPGDWSNYIRAAASHLVTRYGNLLRGANILFEGKIPPSAGLSSSSALVIASALALIATNAIPFDPVELAEMMAEGERYVGTEGGGMDQAVCLLGRTDIALRIDFFPLRHSYIPFPADCSVIVAHSLIRAAKTENARVEYNRRPAECRLAVALINRVFAPTIPLHRLGDLPRAGFYHRFGSIESFIDQIFPRLSCTLDDIANIMGESSETVVRKYLTTRDGIPMPEPADGFRIRQRVQHVLSEARRVEEGCRMLGSGDAEGFGKLMSESHRSCDELYTISTPELNALSAIMRNAGALGARLTGAGFGGCAIALVRDHDVETILDAVRAEYYGKYLIRTRPELLRRDILFAVKPSSGAKIEPFTG